MDKFFRLTAAIFFGLNSFVRKSNMKMYFFCAALVFGFVGEVAAQQPLNSGATNDLYQHGLDLMTHHQYGAARDAFSTFSLQFPGDPRNVDAQYRAAFCAVNLYHADGEKQMESFIASNPSSPQAATAYYELASLFYQQKNYVKAIGYYAKADFKSLSAEQQNTGRFHWGYSLFNLKKLKEALDQFTFIKAQGGTFGPAASYYAGFIEYGQGDYTNALIDLKRAELNASYATIVPNLIMQSLVKQKKLDEALTYYNTVKGREGMAQLDDMALAASEVHFKKNDFAKALEGYQTYLDGKKITDRNLYYRAGYSAMKSSQDALAITYLENSALGSDSVASYASYYLASIYLKTNQKQQALTGFEVAKHFKGDVALAEESSFQYAKISYDLGRSDQAINELEKFMLAYPQSDRLTEVKEILSHAYINANNYNKAIEYIESLPRRNTSLDKAYQKATYLKGTELFNMERYPEAIAQFEKSLQFPIDAAIAAESNFWAGEAFSIGKKYEQAIEHYAHLISPSAQASVQLTNNARYGLGYSYYNQKLYDRALFNFREFVNKADARDVNYSDALLRLADCYYVAKSYAEALTTYRKVIQTTSPDKDYALLQLGVILGIQRKYAEANSELMNVVTHYPQSSYREEALFQIAQLDFEQGKYAPASAGYSKVIEGNATSRFVPYALMRRAASYYNLKEYGKTADDYISVLSHYSSHPVSKEALLPLQEALNLSGRSGEFDQYLGKFKTANPDAKGIESIEFETASSLFFGQQYARAVQSFTAYLSNYPDSPRLLEARYYLAESFYRQKEFDKALAEYQTVASENSFSMIAKVFARIGELEFKRSKFDQAILAYNKLTGAAGNKKDQYTSWAGLMESYFFLAQYDSAEKYARIILEKGNINAGAANKASLYLGKTAMARGDYETAKDEFLNTLNTARDEYGAEAKYLLGEIFFLMKEHKPCYDTMLGLISDFSAYTEWVGKAYLLLADDYLAQGNRFQAQKTLQSILDNDFPVAHIKAAAIDKLKQLNDEMAKEKEVSKDSTDNR